MQDQRLQARAELLDVFYAHARQNDGYRLLALGGGWDDRDEAQVALDLCNVIVALEYELERARVTRQWQALERLLAAVPPGGEWDEIQFLPRRMALAALRDANTLGWLG